MKEEKTFLFYFFFFALERNTSESERSRSARRSGEDAPPEETKVSGGKQRK